MFLLKVHVTEEESHYCLNKTWQVSLDRKCIYLRSFPTNAIKKVSNQSIASEKSPIYDNCEILYKYV